MLNKSLFLITLVTSLVLNLKLSMAVNQFETNTTITTQTFASASAGTSYTLTKYGEGPGAKSQRGSLSLLSPIRAHNEQNVIAFNRTSTGTYDNIKAKFSFSTRPGAEGGGFVLLNTDLFQEKGKGPKLSAWESPNTTGSFSIGFDVYNPPTSNWFDKWGNYYDRPQREISIHWDGLEQIKKTCDVDIRDGEKHLAELDIAFVIGGAEITLRIDEKILFDSFFIAEMLPYESRVCFGARTTSLTTHFDIDDVFVEWKNPTSNIYNIKSVNVFNKKISHAGNRTTETMVQLPITDLQKGRIICTLKLEAPNGGPDPWDKSAAIYAWNDNGERFEIVRFITPYGRLYEWKIDVTDFQSFLRGKTKMGFHIDTWMGVTEPAKQKGWLVSVDLDYYIDKPDREAIQIHNLWTGNPAYDEDKDSIYDFFTTKTFIVPADITDAKLRFMVTGHGGRGEFTPADRTVIVNGKRFDNTLWKTDCYLNPLRPQGGTWKFDRTGWAPGDVVKHWEIEIGDIIKPGKKIQIEYIPHPLKSKRKARAWHWFESQIVYYRSTN